MNKYEAILELNQRRIEKLPEYIAYCKYYFKIRNKEKIKFYGNFTELQRDFPFLIKDIRNVSKYKSNETLKDFPLNWLKNEIIGNRKSIEFENDQNIIKIKQISGIFDDTTQLQEYIQKLPKYSFAIWFKFRH